MEYIVHLNDITNLDMYKKLGIKHFVVGCQDFSYRQSLSLNLEEIKSLKIKLSNERLYILVNALIDESMVSDLLIHLDLLNQCNIDGVLFQDFAILQIVKENNYNFEIIYSPDTLNTNYGTLNFLYENGISGALLAREISLQKKLEIKNNSNCKIIIQGHGVEYMASSKRKLLTNYFERNKLNQDVSKSGELSILANNTEDNCYIYEDKYATHIVTSKQLCSLDVLDKLSDFDFIYLDSLYINTIDFYKIVEAYSKAKNDILTTNGENLSFLYDELKENISADFYHSFLFDDTVYKISDVRKREGKEV